MQACLDQPLRAVSQASARGCGEPRSDASDRRAVHGHAVVRLASDGPSSAPGVERQPTFPLPTTMMAGFGRCDEIAYSLISSLILSLATVSSRLSLDVVAHASTSADCLLAAARRR